MVDLAAMRSAMARLGGDPGLINPQIPVDLVVDHSIQVDAFGTADAMKFNADLEFERNRERYTFLRWAQSAFDDFRVVPPSSGICHQVNLEYLADVVRVRRSTSSGDDLFFLDTVIGTDSHTTMIGGLGIVGWGVGGIEAEAVMLGQPLYMLAPAVIGVKLLGSLPGGATATDLVLVVTERLREKGVVGKFVEFYGPGLDTLTVPDRATIANMAPEYGATIGFFPVDQQTLAYLRGTGRGEVLIERVRQYCTAQDLFRTAETPDPLFADTLEIDLNAVSSCLSGPKRPQDRIPLGEMKRAWSGALSAPAKQRGFGLEDKEKTATGKAVFDNGDSVELKHGAVAISAITSCTNTSNPSVLLTAGLLAQKAVERGLTVPPWVKTSLAPGSTTVTDYLTTTGLLTALEKLGFHVVGYGCTTCIGNSGPLPEPVARAVEEADLVVAGVLSGNRNFEGRINPLVKANYLASPPLVVAYALAGTVDIDLTTEPIGTDSEGKPVMLAELWPTPQQVVELENQALNPDVFRRRYNNIELSNQQWNDVPVSGDELYQWDDASDYIQEPPFFTEMGLSPDPPQPIADARVLVMVGDSVTTDHISPAGAIPSDSPAGQHLLDRGVKKHEFNSYGSRRGNDRVMTRGTFGNIRLKNQLAPGTEGGFTTHLPTGDVTTIHEASNRYQAAGTPTIVLAGKDYGMGSSRDWAAKGTRLLGIRAVLAESFERIHRSNLVGMGVLPLQFKDGDSVTSLGLTGQERFTITLPEGIEPGMTLAVRITPQIGEERQIEVTCRIDTPVEVDYFRNGGILQTVLRGMLSAPRK